MSAFFPSAEGLSRHAIFPGVTIRTCAGKHITLSQAELAAGAEVREHSHPNEQLGIVLDGRLRFTIGSEERVLGPGDVFVIPSNVPHRVVVLDQPARVLDIFHPVREEYR